MAFWGRKNTVSKSFFRVTLPKGWTETPVDAGARFQDEGGLRSIVLKEILHPPTPSAEMGQVLAFVTKECRETFGHTLAFPLQLDAVKAVTTNGMMRMSFAASHEKEGAACFFFVETAARATLDGGYRLVAAYYEDHTVKTLEAVERAGSVLLASLEVPNHATPPRSEAAASNEGLIHLREAAVVALREALGEGDVVWAAVERSGPTGFSYVLEIRSAEEPPEDSLWTQCGDIRVAVEGRSSVLLRGTTIDYVPGGGFRFDNPNAKQG